ncbi:LysM domain-containing protein [Paenibacillus mesophilus]|uniref:LysM domain-containing protein n=1 Tax=Paenibacillus mesophilus TaxID=2582849 RepID=UPI00192E38C0|nr:LysM domain-containing protein [Paenibacillus mesophilus]
MDRQFGVPFGGFGFNPFFFPRRRFVPFFFFSPFFFPFFPFREGVEDRDGTYYKQHTWSDGDTMEQLAQTYNVPGPVLEAVNPHIQAPYQPAAGTVVHIPRMDKMFCQKMYVEQDVPEAAPYSQYPQQQYPSYAAQPAAAYPAYPYPVHPSY